MSLSPHAHRGALLLALLAALSLSAIVAKAAPENAPTEQRAGEQVVNLAEQYVGTPYRWGGASPSGFDCTGFVMWVYRQFDVDLPHNEAGQLHSGESVGVEDLEPGDVLVFANTYRAGLSHVGIYIGDGQFVHAANERYGVTISNLWDSYWGPRLVGATRELA